MSTNRIRRRSIRLSGYVYAKPGWYYITICTHDREQTLSSIRGGRVVPSITGQIVLDVWRGVPERFRYACLDRFVLMPHHVHGIIAIRRMDPRASGATPRFGRSIPGVIATIVGSFKSASTRLIHATGIVTGPVWQRNYYERIIRDSDALRVVRRYIDNNPAAWERTHR